MNAGLPRLGRHAEPDSAARQDAHRLAALAHESGATGVQRRCLVLGLSHLPAELRRPHHIRLASDALDTLLLADRAQRFLLPNHDIAVVWRGMADSLLAASQEAVLAMFAGAEGVLPKAEAFWRVLELPEEAETLHDLAIASLAGVVAAAAELAPGVPFDPAALAALEAALAQADIARFVRRRRVCAVQEDGAFHLAWEAREIALHELCAELAPGRDALAEPWLYRRLARTLDRRLLALLAGGGELHAAPPFGLDLAVGSLLSADFLRFDAALPQTLRGRVMLGLEPADIFADLAAFLFARDFAHGRGYLLRLRLPTSELLATVPPIGLGLDLAEIVWSKAAMMLPTDLLDHAASRLVLTGADDRAAIAWGRANGVRLFEGRAVHPS